MKQLKKEIAKRFPELAARNSMLYIKETDWVLRGICFDSIRSQGPVFRLWAVLLPLYPVACHLSLNTSRELGPHWWDMTILGDATIETVEQAIRTEGLAYLQLAKNLETLNRSWDKLAGSKTDDFVLEKRAYTDVLLGKHASGAHRLQALIDDITEYGDTRDWVLARRERASLILGLLNKDPVLAVDQLDAWCQQSKINLKLE